MAMDKEIVRLAGMDDALAKMRVPISTAVKANGFVFVSGLPPLDLTTGQMIRGDIRQQAEQSLQNVKAALEAAGSSLDRVVKVTVYITNAAHFEAVNRIYERYFPERPPARTFVAMASWPAAFDIEIECVATV
jgi:reactive intermediate/imine deaminase